MKHVVDIVNAGQAGGATLTARLALGTLNPDPYTNVDNVKAGSIIRALEIQLDVVAENAHFSGNIDYMDWYVWFNINGVQVAARPDIVGGSHLKNQVFHQEGGLFREAQQVTAVGIVSMVPMTWRLSLVLPRQWRQVNDGDTIELVYRYSDATVNHDLKLKCIYKEYFP